MFTLRRACLLLSFCFAATSALAAPPAQAFFQTPQLDGPSMSPDGRHVLVQSTPPGERTNLLIIDLASMKPRVLVRYADADVTRAYWLSDKRVSYILGNTNPRIIKTMSGLYAVDIDGGDKQGLAEAHADKRSFAGASAIGRGAPLSGIIPGLFQQNTDRMYVVTNIEGDLSLARIDTRKGRKVLMQAPVDAISWLFDDSETLRVVVTRDRGRDTLRHLGENGLWREVLSFDPRSDEALSPVLYANKTLYVEAKNGKDKTSLYRFNIKSAAIEGGPLVTSPDYDIAGSFVTDSAKMQGYRLLTDARETVWFDPVMAQLQKDVDQLLPATVNKLSRGARSATPYVLVVSDSPVQPGIIRIYHQDTKQLTVLGKAMPKLVASDMAATEMKRYKARDGLSIPAYVTLPDVAVPRKLPTIILVKPFSWLRGADWGFDPDAQFLASRGYAVIQPEPRGTGGFGTAFYKAGHKQWGLAMQDDLADGARWAIAEGIADPARICIAGGGFGGYAAMMGLIKDAQLFRCAVNWGGIVDIDMMFKRDWQGTGMTAQEAASRIGDVVRDKAQFAATSPLQQAARINNPVFLAYGAQDVIVPGKHGQLLYDALKAGNPAAEFHLFDEKDQSWSLEKNRTELWTRIEKFLEKHIGAKP